LLKLRLLRLETVRSKILVFALTAALVPSGLTAWVSYTQNRRALEAKIKQELLSSSGQAAREMDVWLKERLYDLRVFASSYEVSEKLSRRRPGSSPDRLTDYLASVRDRFAEYEELVVFDPQGRPVAYSGSQGRTVRLPADWAKELSTNNALVGEATWDSHWPRACFWSPFRWSGVKGECWAPWPRGSACGELKRVSARLPPAVARPTSSQ
jgi:hypothetical protein